MSSRDLRISGGRIASPPCQHPVWMLAALNIAAIALGVAAGSLLASLVALTVGGLLSLAGMDTGPDIGLVIGVLTGLFAGGWLAGSRAVHSERFHGMVAGLLLAFVVVIVARLRGSPAPTPVVVWLAIVSIAIAGLGGWLAGGRRATDG